MFFFLASLFKCSSKLEAKIECTHNCDKCENIFLFSKYFIWPVWMWCVWRTLYLFQLFRLCIHTRILYSIDRDRNRKKMKKNLEIFGIKGKLRLIRSQLKNAIKFCADFYYFDGNLPFFSWYVLDWLSFAQFFLSFN